MDLAPPPADAAPSPAPPPDLDDQEPTEGLLGGVAALLADRLGVEALWLRIAFVLLALVGGIGVVVYGALWLAFVVGADPDRRWARLAGGTVLVIGLPLVLSGGFDFFDGPVAILALLIGLAVALWQPRPSLRPAAYLRGARAARTSEDGAPEGDATPPARRLPRLPKRPPRPPSILGRLVLGIAVLVAAGGALIDQANGGRLHPEQWLGAAAVVCGVGLVVGAFAGRALWLIVPAIVFAGAGFVAGEAARIGVEPTALVGDQQVSIGEGSSGERREHVVVGTVDVSIEGRPAAPMTVDARSGIGEVRIWAARDVTVEVDADVSHGDVHVAGVERPDGSYRIGPEGPPDVVVLARVGRGSIQVTQWERVVPELAPVPPIASRPPVLDLEYVADGVALAPGGQLILADGEAVIDADDTVLSGAAHARDRVTVIPTSYGEFQLLPGGLLLTPSGELLDLRLLRGSGAAPAAPPAPAPTAAPATDPAPSTSGTDGRDRESVDTTVPDTLPGG